jgi:hypothetical protein
VPQDELKYLLEVYEPYELRRDDGDAVVAALHDDFQTPDMVHSRYYHYAPLVGMTTRR